MGVVATAARILAEGDVAEQSQTSPYVIGGFALAVLIVALIVTAMINVDR
jgi:hypothetical protein